MSSSVPDELALDGGAPWDGLVSKALAKGKETLAKGKKAWSNIKEGIKMVNDSGLIKHLIDSDGENPMQSLKIASDNLRKKEVEGNVATREEDAKGSHVTASSDAATAQKDRDHDAKLDGTDASKTANGANGANASKTANGANASKTANGANASKTANGANASKTANGANGAKTANGANGANATPASNAAPASSTSPTSIPSRANTDKGGEGRSVGWLPELYTWSFFMAVFAVAWDSALRSAVTRIETDASESLVPLRRPYLVTLCAYALAHAWFNIAFLTLLTFVGCTVLCMTAPIAAPMWEMLVNLVARPEVVLRCMSVDNAPTHFVFAVCTLFASALVVGFYLTDEDLLTQGTSDAGAITSDSCGSPLDPPGSSQTTIIKVTRALFTVAGGMMAAYGVLALYRAFMR